MHVFIFLHTQRFHELSLMAKTSDGSTFMLMKMLKKDMSLRGLRSIAIFCAFCHTMIDFLNFIANSCAYIMRYRFQFHIRFASFLIKDKREKKQQTLGSIRLLWIQTFRCSFWFHEFGIFSILCEILHSPNSMESQFEVICNL